MGAQSSSRGFEEVTVYRQPGEVAPVVPEEVAPGDFPPGSVTGSRCSLPPSSGGRSCNGTQGKSGDNRTCPTGQSRPGQVRGKQGSPGPSRTSPMGQRSVSSVGLAGLAGLGRRRKAGGADAPCCRVWVSSWASSFLPAGLCGAYWPAPNTTSLPTV